MKKIIKKTAVFVVPFLLFYVITELFYNNSADVMRVGFFPVIGDYKSVFKDEFNRKIYFSELSALKTKKAKILTIGDSFSDQNRFGYKNYLAEKYSVLHVDRFISQNQIQTLYQFINTGFFEEHNIEYVVLEHVERNFVVNAQGLDLSKTKIKPRLDSIVNNHKNNIGPKKNDLFSKNNIIFPFSMLRFYIDQNYLSNEMAYNVTLKTNKLFSNNSNKLLFTWQDMTRLEQNNDPIEVCKLNDILNDLSNKLSHKSIKLIVLPAPDKYDLYYDYIADKTNFTKPLFFQYLASLKKDYIYIDSKKVLTAQLESKKDVYFYDDTHWSPVASKIISKEIEKVIK